MDLKVYDKLALIPRNEQSDLGVTMPNSFLTNAASLTC